MSKIETQSAILRAKETLESFTPLRGDCGRLCGKRCCGGEGLGMELLPGEEKLSLMEDFGEITNDVFVCRGVCERRARPYACMIFPLFPLVKEDENGLRIAAVNDLRALPVCPIASARLLPSFYRAVRRSAYILCEDPEIQSYLLEKTAEYEEIENLKKLLF